MLHPYYFSLVLSIPAHGLNHFRKQNGSPLWRVHKALLTNPGNVLAYQNVKGHFFVFIYKGHTQHVVLHRVLDLHMSAYHSRYQICRVYVIPAAIKWSKWIGPQYCPYSFGWKELERDNEQVLYPWAAEEKSYRYCIVGFKLILESLVPTMKHFKMY